MKLGVLTLALGLLLVLPSATVLALTGSLDRTMKAGTALLLLASLHSVSSEDGPPPPVAPTKSAVDGCGDSMVCFAPQSCQSGGDDHETVKLKNQPIADDCKVIIKIRPYSTTMYRVVLESRDPEVNEITVTREGKGPIFSCKAGSKPQYKGSELKSIASNDKPLMCEFIAKESDSDIFQNSLQPVNILTTTNGPFESKTSETTIQSALVFVKYCNPADAIYDDHNPGLYFVEPVTIGLTDLTCPEKYQLETRLLIKSESRMESEFIKTASIVCEKGQEADAKFKFNIDREEDGNKIPFEPAETFHVRCAVKTCSLCDHVPADTSIVDAADGCKELKCTAGRLKVGEVVGDSATCKKTNDKPAWDLNGTPIEKSTAVLCASLKTCSDANAMCDETNKCSLDTTSGAPTCTSGQMTFQSKQVTQVSCNTDSGKWMYTEGGTEKELPEGSSLSCASAAGTSGQQGPVATGQTALILAIIFGVIILIALAVGFGIYFHRLRKARVEESKRAKTKKSMEKLKKQPGSKESKSANSNQSKEERKELGAGPSTSPNKAPPPAAAPPPVGATPTAAAPPPVGMPGAPTPAATTAASATPVKSTPMTDEEQRQKDKEEKEFYRQAKLEHDKNPKPDEPVPDESTNMHPPGPFVPRTPAETTGTRDDTHGDANTTQMLGDTRGDTGNESGIQSGTAQIPEQAKIPKTPKARDVDKGRTHNDETTGGTTGFGPTMVATQMTQGTGTTAGAKKK